MKLFLHSLFTSLVLSVSCVFAASPSYNKGDLIMGFRTPSGTGANANVLVNIGNAASFRDGTVASGTLALGNINTDLTAKFGSGWRSRTDIQWGIAGSPSNTAVYNGDPSQTDYASRPQSPIGTIATGWAINSGARGTVSSLMLTMQGGGASGGFSQSLVSTVNTRVGLQGSGDTNSWTSFQPGGLNSTGTTGFKIFNGGIEGELSDTLDLFRMSTNSAGTYLGSFKINSSGVVTFTAPVVVSGYTSWSTANNLTISNNGSTQDPDSDGIPNALEYVLGGDPLVSNSSILPVQTSDATYIYLSFDRSVDSKVDTTQTVQWSAGLSTWNDIPVGAASSGAVTVVSNGSNPETITVKILKSNASADGKLFTRLKVVK